MTGPVNAELRAIVEAAEAKRPPEINERINRSTAELHASGLADRIPAAGQQAPLFARPNTRGETVRLAATLKKGPVLLSFFRGRW